MLTSDLNDLTEAVKWCDVCRSHVDGQCDGCQRPFLSSEPRYRSQTFHYHPGAIEGVSATRAVQKELCVECYRLDHARAYPDGKVPDLPDRGVDPRFHAAMRTEERRTRVADILQRAAIGALPPQDIEELQALSKVGLRFA